MGKFEQLARQAKRYVSVLFTSNPKRNFTETIESRLALTSQTLTACVKLTSAKAKIRMLKDGKLVKHKSNHEMIKRSKPENTLVNGQNPDKQ